MSLLHSAFYGNTSDVFTAGAECPDRCLSKVWKRWDSLGAKFGLNEGRSTVTKPKIYSKFRTRYTVWSGALSWRRIPPSKKIRTLSQHTDSKSLPRLQTKVNFLSGSPCTAALAVVCGHSPWIIWSSTLQPSVALSTLQPSVAYINITALCCIYQPYSPLLHISTVQSFVAYINRTAICSIYQQHSLLLHISTTFKIPANPAFQITGLVILSWFTRRVFYTFSRTNRNYHSPPLSLRSNFYGLQYFKT